MASYSVQIKRSAARDLEDVPLTDRRRLATRLGELSALPRPPGVEKLSGLDRYRVRQGDYRILYEIDDHEHTVTIVKIGHRRDVYRRE